jgi:hypothetical protein
MVELRTTLVKRMRVLFIVPEAFLPDLLTLLYTCGLGIVVLHVMAPLPYRFSLYFLT